MQRVAGEGCLHHLLLNGRQQILQDRDGVGVDIRRHARQVIQRNVIGPALHDRLKLYACQYETVDAQMRAKLFDLDDAISLGKMDIGL